MRTVTRCTQEHRHRGMFNIVYTTIYSILMTNLPRYEQDGSRDTAQLILDITPGERRIRRQTLTVDEDLRRPVTRMHVTRTMHVIRITHATRITHGNHPTTRTPTHAILTTVNHTIPNLTLLGIRTMQEIPTQGDRPLRQGTRRGPVPLLLDPTHTLQIPTLRTPTQAQLTRTRERPQRR